MSNLFEYAKHFPLELSYGFVAIIGGSARYFQSYTNTGIFSISMFFANVFISGFSGWMFALLGLSWSLPPQMLLMMAGVGGFMGTGAIDLVVRYLSQKVGSEELPISK